MLRVVFVFAVASFVAAFLMPAVLGWFILATVLAWVLVVLLWLETHALEWELADDE